MKAIVVHAPGDPDVLALEELDNPVPLDDEVVVRNTAIGVNMLDVYHRSGRPHPSQPVAPFVPGGLGVGTVERVGREVQDLSPGDHVIYMTGSGAYAELTRARRDRVLRAPEDLDSVELAAIFVRGLTVYYLTFLHHSVSPTDQVLVHAASGGLGQLLCRWLTARDVRVIGTVGSAVKVPMAQRAGCELVVDRSCEDFVEQSMAWTDGRGVDVVYDSVGRSTFKQSLQALRARGHAVNCGSASGVVEEFSLEELHGRSLFVSRPTLATYIAAPHDLEVAAQAVFDAMRKRILVLDRIESFALHEARDAHRMLESGMSRVTPVLLPR